MSLGSNICNYAYCVGLVWETNEMIYLGISETSVPLLSNTVVNKKKLSFALGVDVPTLAWEHSWFIYIAL